MISLNKIVIQIVDVGKQHVKKRSSSTSGVVMNPGNVGFQFGHGCRKWTLTVNVPNVEDLAHVASHLRAASFKLYGNTGPPKVGCHAEIRNGSDQRNGCGDVVKQAGGPERISIPSSRSRHDEPTLVW